MASKANGDAEPTITWKADGTGWEQHLRHGGTIFTKELGLANHCIGVAAAAVRDAYLVSRDPAAFAARITPARSNCTLSRIRPHLSAAEQRAVRSKVARELPNLILESVRERTRTDREGQFVAGRDQSDGLFLASLGCSGRNYKRDCAICLTDTIMGTTCTCGHTEIVVFRPCGHSVCVSPCFKNFCKQFHGDLPKQTHTVNGKTFVTSEADVSGVRGFDCLVCRATVESCFRAETAGLGEFLKEVAREYAAGVSIDDESVAAAQVVVDAEEAEKERELIEFKKQRKIEKTIQKAQLKTAQAEADANPGDRSRLKNGGMWHPGRIFQVFRENDPIYPKPFCRTFSTLQFVAEARKDFKTNKMETEEAKEKRLTDLFGTETWSCCGGLYDSPPCRPCPHFGLLCCCGDDAERYVPEGSQTAPDGGPLINGVDSDDEEK